MIGDVCLEQLVVRHPAPRGQIDRRSRIKRDNLQNFTRHFAELAAQNHYQFPAAHIAGVPFVTRLEALTQDALLLGGRTGEIAASSFRHTSAFAESLHRKRTARSKTS
jgi:hypothetical protein